MSATEYTTIPVTPETRDLVKSLKRGGESYDRVVRKMVDAYEGDA